MRQYQNSRPTKYIPKLTRGHVVPVMAISPRGGTHIYPSISEFARDVEGINPNRRRTANRRVASGGGYVDGWYVTGLRGLRV